MDEHASIACLLCRPVAISGGIVRVGIVERAHGGRGVEIKTLVCLDDVETCNRMFRSRPTTRAAVGAASNIVI